MKAKSLKRKDQESVVPQLPLTTIRCRQREQNWDLWDYHFKWWKMFIRVSPTIFLYQKLNAWANHFQIYADDTLEFFTNLTSIHHLEKKYSNSKVSLTTKHTCGRLLWLLFNPEPSACTSMYWVTVVELAVSSLALSGTGRSMQCPNCVPQVLFVSSHIAFWRRASVLAGSRGTRVISPNVNWI